MEQRIIITGFSGFVGRHLLAYFQLRNPNSTIVGVDIIEPKYELPGNCSFKRINLLDEDLVNALVEEVQPEMIIHLASFSKVSESWINPILSFKNNTNIFLNLIEACRKKCPEAKFLSVGSSEEYGIVDEKSIPLREDYELNPNSPYSVARVAQELMSKVYASGFGMNVVLTRSFNHYGRYQDDAFVIQSIIKQLCQIKAKGANPILNVGNIDVIRDFIHVTDVVKAYDVLLQKGISSEVYNICTGHGFSLREVIRIVSEKLKIEPEIIINKDLYRPNDNPIIIGDNTKLMKLGWCPEILLEQGLDEMINYNMNAII